MSLSLSGAIAAGVGSYGALNGYWVGHDPVNNVFVKGAMFC